MELQQTPVEALANIAVPDKPLLIMPVGDTQYGTEDCDVRMLRDHIRWGVDNGAYFIGMGDYADFASPSNQKKLADPDLYDSTRLALDRVSNSFIDTLIGDALEPSIGRWLGLVRGHHYWTLADGMSSDERLCEKLKAPFLGDCGIIGLKYPAGTVEIWVHHGAGYGQTVGAPLTRLERLTSTFPTVHVFLIGHQHKLVAARHPERIIPLWQSRSLEHQSAVIACTGSFMRGYTAGREVGNHPAGSYVEKGMLPPVALGGILLQVAPRVRSGLFLPDIKVTL